MIEQLDINKIANIVYASVITVPGVAGFAKIQDSEIAEDKVTMLQKDYLQAIRFQKAGLLYTVDIALILIEGVNIYDISQEVQIRVKYELEKLEIPEFEFKINVDIQDLLI